MSSLFDVHTTLRAVIEAGLEGRLGTIVTDGAEPPRVARMSIGCYEIFAGDPEAPEAAAWVAGLEPPVEIIVPPEQAWRDLVDETLGPWTADRPMRTFATHALDPAHLERLASAPLPAGFRAEPIRPEYARRLDDDLAPHALQVFRTPGELVEHGLGVVVIAPDERVAAQSTSYAISTRRVEIALGTHPEFRRLGLARAVAARMILRCLARKLEPAWSASNPVSKRLALSLGYRRASLCDVIDYPKRGEAPA